MNHHSSSCLGAIGKPCVVLLLALGSGIQGAALAGEPAINVWYGDHQHFGRLGNPQSHISILGSVSKPGEIALLTYSLNGGDTRPLTIGPDLRRLANPGDFNIL